MSNIKQLIYSQEPTLVIGVDEVGRGCLAGPVIASAVLLKQNILINGLRDSKKISESKRYTIEENIKNQALFYSIGEASPSEIDSLNILQATFLAMERAIQKILTQLPSNATGLIWVDGNKAPPFLHPGWDYQTFIGGDDSHAPIASASIIAKNYRDRLMKDLALKHPDYGFEQHKGYGTELHIKALKQYGITDTHRMSFRPVSDIQSKATTASE